MNDKLKRAISSAKKAHEHNDGPADATAVAIGALICAVEILADRLQDEPAEQPNPAPNLIERLKKAYVFAEMEAIAGGGDPVDLGVRAIFAELAKMPVELPSEEQIRIASYDIGNADGVMTLEAAGQRVATLFQERLAPILAAKDAEREALNKACLDAVSAAASAEHRLDLAKERIVELEKQRDDGVTGDPQPANSDTTGVEPDWIVERVRSAIKSSYEDLELLKGPSLAVSFRDMAERAIAELRRVDKERELVTIGGKTPGQVDYEAYSTARLDLDDRGSRWEHLDERTKQWNEAGANAVLRAFGNAAKPATNEAVEALQRVRVQAENIETHFRDFRGTKQSHTAKGAIKDFVAIIDAELAKLDTVNRCSATDSWATGERFTCRLARGHEGPCDFGATNEDYQRAKLSAKPPSDPATPKLFVAENELRGSYFCTAITLRPWLHVGHDIEFDDIPRILKLGRNDVVEVRVVERAKQ